MMNAEQQVSDTDTLTDAMERADDARRKYPRIYMRIPVKVSLPDGNVVIAHTRNMTPDGIQIRCDKTTAGVINPTGRSVPPPEHQKVMVMMRMESAAEIHSCVLRCRLSYMAMTKDAEVAFGLRFDDASPEQQRALDTVFAHALCPA